MTRFWSWLTASRRRFFVSIAVAVAVLAAGIAVPIARRGGSAPPAGLATGGCSDARAIDRVAPAASAAWQKVSVPQGPPCYTMTASASDAGGIAPASHFTLTARRAFDPSKLLTAVPAVKLAFKKIGADRQDAVRYEVRPESDLPRGALIRFTLRSTPEGPPVRTWAFQVQDTVRVVQTIPADRSTDVPLDTGIEIAFSVDGVKEPAKNVTVTPATAGRFEVHKRTLVFAPKALKTRTLYTVTVRKGLGAAGTPETLARDATFRFETGTTNRDAGPPQAPVQFTRSVWESAVRDTPALGLFSTRDGTPKRLAITVYRYGTLEAFTKAVDAYTAVPSWADATRNRYTAATDGLGKHTSFTAALQQARGDGDWFVQFPAALPAGFYLVTAATSPPVHTWLQVTDLATYVSVSKRRTVVWVNDSGTAQPISGATVAVNGTPFRVATGPDGIASFDTPADMLSVHVSPYGEEVDTARDLTVTNGTRSAMVPLSDVLAGSNTYEFREYVFDGDPSPYWRFLYTDRRLYRPTDEIRFWGLLRAREGALAERSVDVVVLRSDFESSEPLARTTVKTTKSGTYLGRLAFRSLAVGGYRIEVRVGDRPVSSLYMDVQDFVKPAYKIDVTASKTAVFTGSKVPFGIRTAFFEGTPVPGVGLRTSGAAEATVTTDATGAAGVDGLLKSAADTEYEDRELTVIPVRAEEAEIQGGSSVRVFGSAVGVDSDAVVVGTTGTVSGSAYRIDPERLNRGGALDDYRAGPAAGTALKSRVTETRYRCSKQTQRYDFIAKKVISYCGDWEEVRTDRGTYDATTDASGRFRFTFPASSGNSYEISIAGRDPSGRSFLRTTYAYMSYPGTRGLYLSEETSGPYAVGDKVAVTMREGAAALPSGGRNRYLFVRANNGIRSAEIRTTPVYSFTFADEHAPATYVVGVQFDGRLYREVFSSYTAYLDQETRRLKIRIVPDKDRYRPGETAKLAVAVTGPDNKPRRAEVLLSAIDEAIVKLQGYEYTASLNILDALYQSLPSGILAVYASHQTPDQFAGGESGGEGPGRDRFKDTGLFDRVVTGDDGRAIVPFKVPDNLTSWTVGALGVTDGMFAGNGSGSVRVGLPVFADTMLNSTYLTGEKAFVRVRAFGTALKAQDQVRFTIEVPGLAATSSVRNARAFEPLSVALPPLREGTHDVHITVEGAGAKDTLVRKITVVRSRVLRATTTYQDVAAGEAFKPEVPASSRTTVVLTDHNRGRYVPVLESLAYGSGDRIDQFLSRALAQQLLVKHFKRTTGDPAVFVASRYQTPEGGIALFPYAGADLVLSARVADVASDLFDRNTLRVFFESALTDKATRERQIVALYGLAALGDPVLARVREAAAHKDLTARERLYVGLAAATLGDQDTAAQLYRSLLGQYGEIRGPAVRLRTGTDTDDVLEATSLAAILGAAIGDDNAPALFEYTSTATTDLLVELERISYLSKALPNLPADPVELSYTAAGKRVTKTLADGESVVLDVAPADLKALDLRVGKGTAGVASTVLVPFDPASIKPDPDVSVRRTYDGQAAESVRLRDGQVVLVTLDVTLGRQAEDGCYQIDDLLPSGMRPVTNPYYRGLDTEKIQSYPYAIDGQRVSFCLYKTDRVKRAAYYARVVLPGSYKAESAVAHAQRAPQSAAVTSAFAVEIA